MRFLMSLVEFFEDVFADDDEGADDGVAAETVVGLWWLALLVVL